MQFNPKNMMRPRAYIAGREHIFPSDESLRWFVRQNHAELVSRGAIAMPTGKTMVVADAFDRAVLEIGMRRAKGSA